MSELDELKARLSAAEFSAKHNYEALQQEMTRKMPEGLIDAADLLHKLALARADKLMGAEALSPEGRELEQLAAAIACYEEIRWGDS